MGRGKSGIEMDFRLPTEPSPVMGLNVALRDALRDAFSLRISSTSGVMIVWFDCFCMGRLVSGRGQ